MVVKVLLFIIKVAMVIVIFKVTKVIKAKVIPTIMVKSKE